ncbi:hypothetical protein FOZ63_007246 [Perkinsus olseni]|uniref:Uncharacterized protein n=1 Tax=Perkinsus olseni TaxID=32597 RepID=A0A7J6Q1C1_PEROL|nr:hypothetical protein FOZ63_007246 [Perkinsus olseni]
MTIVDVASLTAKNEFSWFPSEEPAALGRSTTRQTKMRSTKISSAGDDKQMETALLENTILKIGGLLRVGSRELFMTPTTLSSKRLALIFST